MRPRRASGRDHVVMRGKPYEELLAQVVEHWPDDVHQLYLRSEPGGQDHQS